MDKEINPYVPGAGNYPPALVGREEDLEVVELAIRRLSIGNHAQSVIITGLRGVGKTVLLHEFHRIAENHDWVHESLEAYREARFTADLSEMVRQVMVRLSRKRLAERAVQAMRTAMRTLKAFQIRWDVSGGVDLIAGLDPLVGKADSGLLDRDLTDLFVAVGHVASEQKSGVVLTVDEMQDLSLEHLTHLIIGLHKVSQLNLPLVVAGAGLPSLVALMGEARSYAERLFDFREIGRLSAYESAVALTTPAHNHGVRWEPDALDNIWSHTQGYPYFLQAFGKRAWQVAQSDNTITATDVLEAVPLAIKDLDGGFFRMRFDRTTDAERDYLRAMADLGVGPYASGDVATTQGRTTAQLGPTRDSLIRKGLCYSPRHGIIDFTVPMFDQYLRRRAATSL